MPKKLWPAKPDRNGAGIETLPLLSILLTIVDKNSAIIVKPAKIIPKTSWFNMVYYGILWLYLENIATIKYTKSPNVHPMFLFLLKKNEILRKKPDDL